MDRGSSQLDQESAAQIINKGRRGAGAQRPLAEVVRDLAKHLARQAAAEDHVTEQLNLSCAGSKGNTNEIEG
jgi:hypothetical protein